MRPQSTPSDLTEQVTSHLFAEAGYRRPHAPFAAVAAVLWPRTPSLAPVAPATPAALSWGVWPPESAVDAAPYGPYWCEVRAVRDGFAWTVSDSWSGIVMASGQTPDRPSAMGRAGLAALIADIPEPLSVRAGRAFGDWS